MQIPESEQQIRFTPVTSPWQVSFEVRDHATHGQTECSLVHLCLSLTGQEDVQGLKVVSEGISREEVRYSRKSVTSDISVFVFDFCVTLLGLPSKYRLQLFALRAEGAVPLGTLSGTRRSVVHRTCKYRPILLNGLPRSGTTLAMAILSLHPQIITVPEYPYEFRPASCWVHTFSCLGQANNASDQDLNWIYDRDQKTVAAHVYNNPYFTKYGIFEWLSTDYVNLIAEFCVQSIDAFYDRVASAVGKTDATFYLEKFPGKRVNMFREIYGGVTEVNVVRDFRDVYCSSVAFNKKRDRLDFSADTASSPAEYLRLMGRSFGDVIRRATADREGVRSITMRYEDLMHETAAHVNKIYAALGLDELDDLEHRIKHSMNIGKKDVDWHRTSQIPVARWKSDLPEELNQIAISEFGAVLATMGYEASK